MEAAEYARMFACEDRHWWYVALHEQIERLVAREAVERGPLRIFDAGCGTGALLARLARHGEVTGCDASPLALDFCRQRGLTNVTQQDLNHLTLSASQFDVVTCIDVIEHRWVTSDADVLQRLAAGLKPGGLLIVHCTALAWLHSAHDQAVGSIRRYRRGELDRLLAGVGLTERRVTYRLFSLLPAIAMYRLFRRPVPETAQAVSDVWMPSVPVNALLLAATRIEALAARVLPPPAGSSLLAVGRR